MQRDKMRDELHGAQGRLQDLGSANEQMRTEVELLEAKLAERNAALEAGAEREGELRGRLASAENNALDAREATRHRLETAEEEARATAEQLRNATRELEGQRATNQALNTQLGSSSSLWAA